jgi:predicted DNA-binding transcriptional regulator AlpA
MQGETATIPIRPAVCDDTPTDKRLRDRPDADRPTSPAEVIEPHVEPYLVPIPEAARRCGISETSWFRLKSAGKTPPAVKLGGRVLYRTADLKAWVEMGCPDRKVFEARMKAGR